MIVRSLLGPVGAFTTEQGLCNLACFECCGRGFVKQPRPLVRWSFDPCPRCAGTGKEAQR